VLDCGKFEVRQFSHCRYWNPLGRGTTSLAILALRKQIHPSWMALVSRFSVQFSNDGRFDGLRTGTSGQQMPSTDP
jgi:hypothetical protein